jgi:hypothetical protein
MKSVTLLIFLAACFLFLGCPPPTGDPPAGGGGETKTVVSDWFGTYTWSGGDGFILRWTLYDDETFSGSWEAGDESVSLSCSGTYTLTDTDLTFDMAGTAIADGATSQYTGSGAGTLSTDSGSGTYSINFTHPDFTDQFDEQFVLYLLEGNSGIYTIETFSNGGSLEPDTVLYLLDGDEMILASNDDFGYGFFSTIVYPLFSGNTYYISVENYYSGFGYYSLKISKSGGGSSDATPATTAGEPDDDALNATTIFLNAVYDRYLDEGDEDWFVITIP